MAETSEQPAAEKADKGKGKEKEKEKERDKADEQLDSLLFSMLPQEIRDEIYFQIFSTTRLSFTEGMEGSLAEARRVYTLPSPYALALLKVCRRIRREIGDSWLRYVLFNFGSTDDMRKKLCGLPQEIITKIRHVRVCDIPHGYLYVDPAGRVPAVLTELPGLQLDRLTVLGNDEFRRGYFTIGAFVSRSNGWKELHYISQDFRRFMHRTKDPQPSHYQSVLNSRDGAETKPSITIYRSTAPLVVGSVMNPETREV
ncbi:hypothetical protein SAMD00023353_0102470 [Rosellinia necatrix]|uniref:F-box domain-containing protein n=1 Tax=Rosellinia necatrix TaxID=77044 RepID=A0A1S8A4N8_ROSNE|nr:hypothetical protein SAMD00023353_0102470 [Rosellinia necatrix]